MRDRSKRYGGLPYGTCTTTNTTVAKTVSMPGFTPEEGDMFAIKFTRGNIATAMTLNINSTGAKNIRLGNVNSDNVSASFVANAVLLLIYDGTSYQMVGSQKKADAVFAFDSVVTTGSWSADATVPGYGYRAAIAMAGVNTDYAPEVVFCQADAASGLYSMEARTYTGGVRIYAKAIPPASITIPTIVCKKVVY